jgi:hypothetical protein
MAGTQLDPYLWGLLLALAFAILGEVQIALGFMLGLGVLAASGRVQGACSARPGRRGRARSRPESPKKARDSSSSSDSAPEREPGRHTSEEDYPGAVGWRSPQGPPAPPAWELGGRGGGADGRVATQARWRNDPARPYEGLLERRRFVDPYLRPELDEDGERVWWGRHET